MSNPLETVKKWIAELTELGLLLVALAIVIHILFGAETPFIGGVASNLLGLIGVLGKEGLVGLIALGVIIWLFSKKA